MTPATEQPTTERPTTEQPVAEQTARSIPDQPAVAFEYAVVRAVPRVDRGEFVNIAVILYCRALDFLSCAAGPTPDRVLTLDPAADLDAVRAALDGICAVCEGRPGIGAAGGGSLRARFGWLTAPRSTVIQASPVHSGITTDPAAELSRLVTRLAR